MKKSLSLLLVLVLCLSLCACGVNVEEAVVGTWSCTEAQKYDTVIELYKGGTGKYITLIDGSTEYGSNYPITWEVKDGVLNITLQFGVEGFIYNESFDTLTRVDNSETFTRKAS